MKIFNYIVSAAFGTLAMTSCTDLSEALRSGGIRELL